MKELFHALSRTSDGAFIIDGQHRIIFWNQAAGRILGHSAEEVIGRSCYQILGGLDAQGRTLCQRYCLVAIRAERGEVLPNQDICVWTKIGKRRWLNVTTFAYPVVDRTINQVIVHLFRDVTENMGNQRFVDRVLAASEWLQRDKAHRVVSVPPAHPPKGKLTPREQQVLELLAMGLGTSEIASTLTISPSTVRNHLQNILGKLGVHSRLEAIAYAYQNGLVEINEL
jgi:PAS domain S-box-containing protein